MSSILAVPGLSLTDGAFRAALVRMAERHGWDADAIAAVMSVESARTFRADAGWEQWTPKRTATGLIQFIEATAKRLGVEPIAVPIHRTLFDRGDGKLWATWALMGQTPVGQLELVERYFARAFETRRPTRPVDYYLVVFGAAPGLPSSTVIARAGDPRYDQNKGLDRNKDGVLTVGDFEELMASVMGGRQRIHVDLNAEPVAQAGPVALGEVLVAMLPFVPALLKKVRSA